MLRTLPARYIYFSDDLKEGEFVGMEHSQGNVRFYFG